MAESVDHKSPGLCCYQEGDFTGLFNLMGVLVGFKGNKILNHHSQDKIRPKFLGIFLRSGSQTVERVLLVVHKCDTQV